MPYIGTLVSTQPFRFETVTNVSGAVTISWLKQGGILEIESHPGTNAPQDVTIPRRANRVIFDVSVAAGGGVLFKLQQGGLVVEETDSLDTQYVADVV